MAIRSTSFAIMLITAILAVASTSFAADPPKMPWLHEGLCLTYTWYAAVAPGNGSDYRPDENGDWVNSVTGERYSRTTQHGTSGSGWNQVTVACIEGGKAVLSTQSFGDAGALGKSVPVPLQGGSSFVAPIEAGSDYWLDPDKLAALHTDANAGILVEKVRWKTGDQTVDATRVQAISHGNYALHIFDAKTGQCLHFATAARGPAPQAVGPGDMGQGNCTLTHGDLLATRDLAVPWAHRPPPAWVQHLKALHYHGSIVSRGPLPTVPTDVTFDLIPLERGRNWVQFDATSTVQMQGAPAIPPSKSQIALGTAQFGSLWADPATLAHLQQGQVLDEDPITKMKITVAATDGNTVEIDQQNPAGRIISEYDKSTGELTVSRFVNVLSQQELTLKLQSRE